MTQAGKLSTEQEARLVQDLPIKDVLVFREHREGAGVYEWTVVFKDEFNERGRVDLKIKEEDFVEDFIGDDAEEYVAHLVRKLLYGYTVETRVDKWTFEEAGPDTLWEYIGMNEEQYGEFLENKNLPEDWSLPNG